MTTMIRVCVYGDRNSKYAQADASVCIESNHSECFI